MYLNEVTMISTESSAELLYNQIRRIRDNKFTDFFGNFRSYSVYFVKAKCESDVIFVI